MGNPAPQPRTNASKPNLKPKHRHSGSVSNISFTSEDPKPKHRHSGSVSNISFTPEDLKPKHRHSGSVSNISFTPEDLKPKHRHSGSVSNISITPEDLKPKHRHSGSASNISITPEDVKPRHRHTGSVSNISINSEDFSSPSRDVSTLSSVSSSPVSLKEKRLKRRTRSSLGGTEEFIKELDFLTPSSNGRTPDSGTRKELLKPSKSSPSSESAPLEAVSEALPPVPEASVPAHVEGTVEHLPVERANNPVVGKADVGENGGAPRDEKSGSSAEGSVQPGDAVQLADPETNGVDTGIPSTVEMSRDRQHPALDEIVERKSQVDSPRALGNGQRRVTAAGIPLVGTSTEESHCIEPAGVRTQTEGDAESIVEVGPPPESLVSDSASATVPQNPSEQEESTKSNSSEPSVTDATVTAPANGDSGAAPSKRELSQKDKGAKETQEEKVSVQKRIEELEKIAGGRPVHFRSQSLSLPRPFDISHARHYEAEGSKGFRMPVYRAPLDVASVSEESSLEMVGTSKNEDLAQESHKSEVKTSAGGSFPPGPTTTHEIIAQDTESQAVLQDEEGQSASQTVRSSSDLLSDQTEPHTGPIMSEVAKAVDFAPDSMLNGLHLENGTTGGSFVSLPASKAESMENSETPDEIKAHAITVEQSLVEIGKEDGLESGLGEAHGMVSADSVPVEEVVVPKELHSGAPADQTKGNGGKLETAEAGVVEAPPGAQKVGAGLEAHQTDKLPEAAETGNVPVTHQRSTLPEVPSVPTSVAEQSSQDLETSMLLTKQPAVDPLFIDSQQDRLWEMHSQELTIEESSGQEVRESSAQDDDPRQYANGTPTHAEVEPAGSTANGNAQSDKSGKVDRPRTPLRSLLAEEDAEKCPDSGPLGTPPQNHSGSPRGNLFKRIVSGGKNSPTKQTTPSKFSPKSQPAAKPFLSSCICCSVK